MKLKYLFEAEYFDGTVYKQNKTDTSLKHPPTLNEKGVPQGKSSYTDILEDVERCNIKRFTLIEQSFLGRKYTVDLYDGHFELDGVTVWLEGQESLPTTAAKFKLIYFLITAQQITSPALFNNPLKIEKIDNGALKVTNRIGGVTVFNKIAKMWTVDEEGELDGIKQKIHKVFVLPDVPVPPRRYMLGWQTTIAGKSYIQKMIFT